MRDLKLGGARLTQPLDGSGPTGSVCGFGPELVVDGRATPTRVIGQIGSVVAKGQLAVRACGIRNRIALGAGEHRVVLRSNEQFQPVELKLDSVEDAVPVERSRSLEVLAEGETERVVRVGEGEEAILSLPQSFNVGWAAELDGVALTPLQVDGWSQGWLVPEGAAGDVVLTYEPQRPYLVLLLGGLVLLGLVVLAGLVVAVTTRLRPGHASRAEPTVHTGDRGDRVDHPGQHRRRRLLSIGATGLALGLVAYAVGGPVVALGALLGAALGTRPRWAQTVAAVALVAAVIALVLQVQSEQQFPLDGIDLATGFGLALALAASAVRREPAARPPVRAGHAP